MDFRSTRHVIVPGLAALVLGSMQTAPAAAESTTTTTRISTNDEGGFSYFFLSSTSGGERSKDLSFALVDPAQPDLELIGTRDGREAVGHELERSNAPVMWFRSEGKSYLLTDAELVSAGRELCEPLYWLAQAQTSIIRSQSDLGTQRSRENRRITELAQRLGELSLRAAEARRKGQDVSDLMRQRQAIEREREELVEQQESIRRGGEALGRQEQHVGAKQSQISQRLSAAVARLFEEARDQGKAKPIE